MNTSCFKTEEQESFVATFSSIKDENIFNFEVELDKEISLQNYELGLQSISLPQIYVKGTQFTIKVSNSPLSVPTERDFISATVELQNEMAIRRDLLLKLKDKLDTLVENDVKYIQLMENDDGRWTLSSKYNLHIRMNSPMRVLLGSKKFNSKLKKKTKRILKLNPKEFINKRPSIGFVNCNIIYNKRERMEHEKLLAVIPMKNFYHSDDCQSRTYEPLNIQFHEVQVCKTNKIGFKIQFPTGHDTNTLHNIGQCHIAIIFRSKRKIRYMQISDVREIKGVKTDTEEALSVYAPQPIVKAFINSSRDEEGEVNEFRDNLYRGIKFHTSSENSGLYAGIPENAYGYLYESSALPTINEEYDESEITPNDERVNLYEGLNFEKEESNKGGLYDGISNKANSVKNSNLIYNGLLDE